VLAKQQSLLLRVSLTAPGKVRYELNIPLYKSWHSTGTAAAINSTIPATPAGYSTSENPCYYPEVTDSLLSNKTPTHCFDWLIEYCIMRHLAERP